MKVSVEKNRNRIIQEMHVAHEFLNKYLYSVISSGTLLICGFVQYFLNGAKAQICPRPSHCWGFWITQL